MSQNNVSSVRDMLEQLSTAQLDEMLHRELSRDVIDDHSVRMILSVLEEREKDFPVKMTPKVEAAWEKFQRDTAQYIPRAALPGWIRRTALMAASFAAVILLLITVIPRQAEAGSFWDGIVRWTADIVEFFSPNDNSDRFAVYQFKTENPGLQQVYDFAVEMGVTDPVVPMWLPDGYVLEECKTIPTPAVTQLLSRFKNGNSEIVFCIDIYSEEVSHKYYRDDTEITEIALNETTFHIMKNNDVRVAIWTVDKIECSIFIDCQEDTLIEILKSIYMMEDV